MKPEIFRPDAPCPCGRPTAYGRCCGALHAAFEQRGVLEAPDAEALMRSRYSAFVLELPGYLLATWHPLTRPAQLEPNEPGLTWLGLEVKRHEVQDATHATVTFVARSKLGGRAHRLQETSRFERVDGAWLYRDGDLG
ncbi:SEC-C motif-containing protein [Roseateles sp. YR242]|uniref:YchJ family protein n=1 Tax=Roseateles sp. YR242 TaxID=1855305 RepID=UPI0008C33446|nr:YchJ family metal-binding protein [Roseateles sp. YR242]SEL87520.1 SEC-C motif-containing protein [Roseateles sp. YR242]